ncbi:glycosyltransferase [Psychrobacillus sp. FSL K6-2836]|uniref:glycosyltransferase n=1 Tax=Psychrobacillus sp. FSL K6-2836 TaxID=2921548 RepID=UPI004040A850
MNIQKIHDDFCLKLVERFEVIVINGKSTDKTGEIVGKFAKSYSFIKTIHMVVPYFYANRERYFYY